jgi:hypothetical protein
MRLRHTLLTVTAVAMLPAAVSASTATQPRYYFILFGGQSVPFIPRTSHTWATYVKATPTVGSVVLDAVTISWLPVDGDVRVRNLRPVQGKNHTLDETLAVMMRHRTVMSIWGPYEIDGPRYELAVRQAELLESGRVRYRVIDSFRRNPLISHCVHAVTYADPVLNGAIQPVLRVGEPGTSHLAARFARCGAFVGLPQTHDWLIPALGLECYPLTRREPGEFIRRHWLR